MVTRKDKRVKFARWRIYFAKSPQVRSRKTTLHEIVEAGRAKIAVRDVSKYVVELVWQNVVTWQTPSRLVRLATRQNASLETVIADDVYFPADEAAAAAPTGVADDARGPQMKLRLLL